MGIHWISRTYSSWIKETLYTLTNSVEEHLHFSLQIHQCLPIVFLVIAILTDMAGGNIIVVCICISLIISDIEHLFIHVLSTSMFSLRNVYSGPLPIFNRVICFVMLLLLSFKCSLHILEINFYQIYGLPIFLPIL